MKKIRFGLIALLMLLCSVTYSTAQVSIGIGLPNVSIGINLPLFPELVPVPGYPVYYAPQVNANYFFYDGMYWVYQNDNWYASSWYNGPWGLVGTEVVPLFILRIPVSYYRQPPVYFRGWQSNAPPRWGEHWGHNWEQRRSGWDRWNRGSVPMPAPLPVYQRRYSGDRYPRVEQQQTLRSQNYRYQPRDTIVRQHFKQQVEQKAPAPAQQKRQAEPTMKSPKQQAPQRSTPLQQGGSTGPRSQPAHQGGENVQKSAPVQTPPQQRAPAIRDQKQQPEAVKREQQAPRSQGQEQKSQDKGNSKEPNQGNGQGQQKDEERGQGRNN
ncbi:MAG TPA: hypothetical protein VHN12_09920 [Geobacteraceae bacterium]|nr:hypothetical protein [Geobacteraceae bacterium]